MDSADYQLPPRPAEAHALAVAVDELTVLAGVRSAGLRIVTTTVGRAQAAASLASEMPGAEVVCWFLDRYRLELATASLPEAAAGPALVCGPDLPPGPWDLAVVPLSKDGEAELSREILQSALVNLRVGGRLVTAIDNPRDTWLREQLADSGERVRVRPSMEAKAETIAYVVEKTQEPLKIRDFSCEIVFRDRERLLKAFTRPGVFAHRRIDPGARQLLNAVDLAPETRVLDIGCGSGCVAIGMAARDPTVRVHAFDSSARAVECTLRGAAANDLANLTVSLEAAGDVPALGEWDLALANPPYYADFRIAEAFVDSAWRALAPGGTLLVVTKQPGWYLEHLPARWSDVQREIVKNYHLVEAVRPSTG
jgi:16S rRNA (guanine1207-N2)-methyltransferase